MNASAFSNGSRYVTVYRPKHPLQRDSCPVILAIVLSLVCMLAWMKGDKLKNGYIAMLFFVAIFIWAILTLLFFFCCRSRRYDDIDSDLTNIDSREDFAILSGPGIFPQDRMALRSERMAVRRLPPVGATERQQVIVTVDKPPSYEKLEFNPVVQISSDASGSSASSGSSPPSYDRVTEV